MTNIVKTLRPAFMSFLMMTLICGVIYTSAVTGISQLIFPSQADGSMISVTLKDGTQKKYGSELIGQVFTKAEYLIGRPVGVTNLSAVSVEQEALVQEKINWLHALDPENKADIPADLVMASGSGADPNISPKAAAYQVERIARERGINEKDVRAIIEKYTVQSFLGFWGEPGVNVLKVNLALDGLL